MRDASRLRPLLLLGLCGVLCFVGLGGAELYRNEGLRALVAVETLRTGSWAVPTLHGEPQLTKPPGMTVAIALCSWPFGQVSPASARLPSALAGCCAVFLVYATFARLLGARFGLIAGAIVPCSALWLDRAPSAEIDLVQLAWVTGSAFFLLRAVEVSEEGQGRWLSWAWWQAALLCVAGGFLTKWTAPAFFYLTAFCFLAWRRRLPLLLGWPHLLAVLLALLPCLAWGLVAGRTAGWEALADTVGREALQRLSPSHHPRPYPYGELISFPIGFLLACLPWSALALATLHPRFGSLWDEGTRRLLHLLHAWVWRSLVFWTVVPGHRPRHTLPLQPALACLAALVWIAWSSGRLRWPVARLSPGRALAGLVLAWVGVKLIFVLAVVPGRVTGQEARTQGEFLASKVPAGATLHLCRLKDEGLLFYSGLATRRVQRLDLLPADGFALLTAEEWEQAGSNGVALLARLNDEQGAPLVLVRAVRSAAPSPAPPRATAATYQTSPGTP